MTAAGMETAVSWGRVTRAPHAVSRPQFRDELPALLASLHRPALAYGLGRSYGDSCLNPGGALVAMRGLDRFIAFDRATGVIRAEAGASLGAILRVSVPAGWFLPVTPGTRFVTLAGAVANDVHGKNHHGAGTFGRHVRALGLLRSDGPERTLTPGDPLFAATVGGLGLTGVITWVELQLARIGSAWLQQTTLPFAGIDGFFDLAAAHALQAPFTVAWIDCTAKGRALGRGHFSHAHWRDDGDYTLHAARPRLRVPVEAPSFALNPFTLATFNSVYQARAEMAGPTPKRLHYSSVFYPLDGIADWNRLYGRRGFYQYQCVVPPDAARDAVRAMLGVIAESGEGSFLAVLKTFGATQSPGLLSFPTEGATLALDFANRGDRTLRLLGRLDAIVAEAGGRLYPAKDGRMPAAMLQAGYPGWRAFAAHVDPALSSAFWRRVSA